MTREVAKICEKRAPGINQIAVLYSNTFNNNVNNVNNVSSLLSLFGFFFVFFFCWSIVHYQSNTMSWIHTPKEILSKAFLTRSLRRFI